MISTKQNAYKLPCISKITRKEQEMERSPAHMGWPWSRWQQGAGGRKEGGSREISWELAVNRKTRYAIFPESPTPTHLRPPPGPRTLFLSSLPAGGRPHRSPHRTAPKRITGYKYATHPTSTVSFSHRRAARLHPPPPPSSSPSPSSRATAGAPSTLVSLSRLLLPHLLPPLPPTEALPRRVRAVSLSSRAGRQSATGWARGGSGSRINLAAVARWNACRAVATD
jgi:hypothetical protein